MSTQSAHKRAGSESRPVPDLREIYFYLTEGCNMACRHCWLSPGFDETGSIHTSLQLELFETAIREALPLGLRRVKLTGGEPLLHPEFSKLLEIIRHKNLSLTIETNGLLCTPEIAEEIARLPESFVSVSIDGAYAGTHDWIRGVPGAFKKAQQAVRNLAEAGIEPQIVMSIMRCNADQVDAVIHMAEKLGASSVKFNVIQPTARGERLFQRDDVPGIEDLISLGRRVEMELAPTTGLQLFFDYPMAFRALSRIASGDSCGICGIQGILGIMPGGQYALCGIGEHVRELVFGTVAEDLLADVWQENAVLKALREGLPDRLGGVCSRCLMKRSCLGSCVAQNYYRTDSLWAPFWFCEEAEKAGLFPGTRLGAIAERPGKK